MTTRPICEHCGQAVRVAQLPRGLEGRFAAWCGCEQTSPTDPHHRGIGYGFSQEEAISAWCKYPPHCRFCKAKVHTWIDAHGKYRAHCHCEGRQEEPAETAAAALENWRRWVELSAKALRLAAQGRGK